MKLLLITIVLLISVAGGSQELFSVTEPASNKPARSITFRFDNTIMNETNSAKTNYHFIPEIMFGVSKKLMISGNLYFSNRTESLRFEGGSLYAKYRFLSSDAIQKHFRMAAFSRIAYNNSDIHQEEINLNGHNTGMEAGLVATQLLRKLALSSSLSYLHATDNGNSNKFVYGSGNARALNYTFSIGRLILPREYKSYRQTNFNLMLEIIGQLNTGSGKYYIDMAPSAQWIFNSQGRLDIGYRKEVSSSLRRTAPNGFFVRLEYTLFNVF